MLSFREMRWTSKLDCLALVTATVLTRFATRSHSLYDLDSVNYALAIDHFDPAAHQPQPPGYFLYVLTARAIRLLTGDSSSALVALSIAASAALVVALYFLTREWFGRRSAMLAGALFVLSPLCWFHGTVALTYIVEAFFSALIGWNCWKASKGSGSSRQAILGALLIGIAAGFRPSSALFLLPLWLFSTSSLSWRRRTQGIAAMIITGLAWFIPMLVQAGGAIRYFRSLSDLWSIVPGAASVLSSSPLLSLARGVTILFILALCFGLFSGLWLLRARTPLPPRQRAFVWIWIAPALLFFALVFLKFVNSGYLLVITPPLFALLGKRAADLIQGREMWSWKGIGAVAFAAGNLAIYLFAPLYCSYTEVRRGGRDLAAVCAQVRSQASPARSVIVGFDSHFQGYRHAAYYLPEYTVLQYPEVRYVSGTRLFVNSGRRTSVLPAMDPSSYQEVVLFPLPDSEESRAFLARFYRSILPITQVSDAGSSAALITLPASSLA